MGRTKIIISNTPISLANQIDNIAKYKDKHTVDFLRPLIRDIINELPEELKQKTPINKKEIKLEGIPQETFDQLKTISKNLGVSISPFLKIKLLEKINEFPDHMKVNP